MSDQFTSSNDIPQSSAALAGPVLCAGFGSAVAMWCLWFVGHLPAWRVPAALLGPVLIAALVAGTALAGRAVDRRRGWLAGGLAGLLSAGLNLLILGAHIAQEPAGDTPAPGLSGLKPSALIIVPGFLALGAAVGAVAGSIAALTRAGAPPARPIATWLARFASIAAIAILPLLAIGGSVATTDSGLAVPDWPTSYGANMFLYPIALMADPQIFLEHTHRLFGSLAGLTTLALALAVLGLEPRRTVRLLAVGVFLLVVVQGLLGWLRISQESRAIAVVHGVVGQAIFALLCGLATMLSDTFRTRRDQLSFSRRTRAFCTGLLHAMVVQLALGATFRQMRLADASGALHVVYTHAAFALVVVVFALGAGFLLSRREATGRGAAGAMPPVLRRTGLGLIATVAVQFLLGWAALFAILLARSSGEASLATTAAGTVIIGTAHQVVGATLFGLAAVGFVWTRRSRLHRPSPPADAT